MDRENDSNDAAVRAETVLDLPVPVAFADAADRPGWMTKRTMKTKTRTRHRVETVADMR